MITRPSEAGEDDWPGRFPRIIGRGPEAHCLIPRDRPIRPLLHSIQVAHRDSNSRSVYSSEHGRLCPHCGLPTKRCQCRANPRGKGGAGATQKANLDGDGIVRVGRTSKGRGGKTVTQITGLQLTPSELRDLAKELKRRCGTGGAVKEGVIEIQGDKRDVLYEELISRDFKVKRTGG